MGVSNGKCAMWAANEGKTADLEHYLTVEGPSIVTYHDEHLNTLLHMAAIGGKVKCIHLILTFRGKPYFT